MNIKLPLDVLREKLLTTHSHYQLSFREMKECGKILFNDEEKMSFYGMSPLELIETDCKIAGKSAIEAIIDCFAKSISEKIISTIHQAGISGPVSVVDLFLGSGNLLYHVSKDINAAEVYGFEIDEAVFDFTKHNYDVIGFNAELFKMSFQEGIKKISPSAENIILLVNPSWGDSFDFEKGLNLLETSPNIKDILLLLKSELKSANYKNAIVIVSAHENTNPETKKYLYDNYNIMDYVVTDCVPNGTNVSAFVLTL